MRRFSGSMIYHGLLDSLPLSLTAAFGDSHSHNCHGAHVIQNGDPSAGDPTNKNDELMPLCLPHVLVGSPGFTVYAVEQRSELAQQY